MRPLARAIPRSPPPLATLHHPWPPADFKLGEGGNIGGARRLHDLLGQYAWRTGAVVEDRYCNRRSMRGDGGGVTGLNEAKGCSHE